MKTRRSPAALAFAALLFATLCIAAPALAQGDAPAPQGIYRGLLPVVKFDISPPLRDLPPLLPLAPPKELREMGDDPFDGERPLGPQDRDPIVQDWTFSPGEIPAPTQSFNGPDNIAGVQPPDPVGDVGPNHYVAMSNLYFAVYDKTGTLLYGPAANNTLWTGFGGACEAQNAGDPIVLYDQVADRWLLTQFTASAVGGLYYNCIALSTTGDPAGTYYRWAISNGANFPDYPKYGVWPDAYYISTRDFTASQVGVGAFALNRAQMIAGNPAPQVVSFFVPNGATPYNIGNGLLPADWDGVIAPPAGSPNYFIGSMDDGAGTGAPQDALTIWEFHVDWVTPASSSFTLAATLPITAFDTMFGTSSCTSSRNCIPQPGTGQMLDILSYRQRPMHRAAYRNFGDHEAIVTNQSVEASSSPLMAGIRWWEIRDLGGTPAIFQEGTYAPGISDGIHRWMGSIAMDSAGNMALGYSASNGTTTFPSSWYTGRLVGDTLGQMPQGEGVIVNGTGSQTSGARWGDYTSLNVDPVDDCTFWYVNEWFPASGGNWTLRIGAFRFNECGTPDYYLGATPASQSICAPANAVYTVNVGSIASYTDPVTLAGSSLPGSATAGFAPNPVVPGNSSTMTVGNTGTVAAGSYVLSIDGTSTSGAHSTTVGLTVFTGAPGAPTLTSPADGAIDVVLVPQLQWSAATQGQTYAVDVATDSGFTNVVYTQSGIAGTSHTLTSALAPLTQYYWRARATNLCSTGANSSTFSFTTRAIPPTLLVDDDNDAPDNLAAFTAWLTAAGEAYDVLDTNASANEPALADLLPYRRVIWWSGDAFGSTAGPGAAAETALASWLDTNLGKCLFLDSQDYLYDFGITAFGTNYLGVAARTNDVTQTQVTGKNFFTTPTYVLSFPANFSNYSDSVTPGAGALVAFNGNLGTPTSTSIYKDNVLWKTVFFTTALEAFPVANQQAVFDRILDYCDAIFQDGFDTGSSSRWTQTFP